MAAMDNPFYFTLGWRQDDPKPEPKVELSSTSAKYYNLRRHSVGPTPTSRRLSAHLLQGLKSREMLDILIVSCKQSDTAELWVTFLTSCFQQICKEEKRPPFKLASIGVDEVCEDSPGCHGSRLQIVVACPSFMERLSCHPSPAILASLVQPATVVAMMLGVQPTNLDNHHLSNLFKFAQWRKMVVKNEDAGFVGDFLGVSMDILSRSWQLQQAINQMKTDSTSAHFSLTPKKIKVGQNKLLVLLTDPVGTSDKVTISVDKNGQKLEISSIKRRNPYTLQFSMPAAFLQTSALVSVNVERNGKSLGQRLVKCESRLRELEQILKTTNNPVTFMCQAVGISAGNREQLDTFMTTALKKNLPPNFSLLSSPVSKPSNSCDELPTLLHFGAKYGLENFCWELIECPGGWQACSIRNSAQMTPAELAEKAGFARLAHAIKGYSQMSELSTMYNYLKGISEKPKVLDEFNYLLPRPLSDTYAVPPAARPLDLPLTTTPPDLESAYQVPSSPVPLPSPSTPIESPLLPPPHTPSQLYRLPPSLDDDPAPSSPHYQVPPSARPFSPVRRDISHYLRMNSPDSSCVGVDIDQIDEKHDAISCSSDQSSMKSVPRSSSIHSCSTNGKSTPQDELIEIINDFKNNVFTISEVEKLVDSWRNRNDVQQSFKERQEQLEMMRQEYERIQKNMKEQMKRATPFERIKKFFSRKSKSDLDGAGQGRSNSESNGQRPLSSLSLHSSSSSSSTGRISTGSGASLGDSGTHSDQDDKRSEEMVFHERLQSVKERCETSVEDYETNESMELPQPPGYAKRRTVVEVHRVSDGRYVNQNSVNKATYQNIERTPTKEEPSAESTIVNNDDYIESNELKSEEDIIERKTEDIEEDPLQPLEDLGPTDLDLLEQSDKILQGVVESLHDCQSLITTSSPYVNISPFNHTASKHLPRQTNVLL